MIMRRLPNKPAFCVQLDELRQVKDGSAPMQSVFEKLDSARSQASSLSEQLATAKHNEEIQHKENVKLQKVSALKQMLGLKALATANKQ